MMDSRNIVVSSAQICTIFCARLDATALGALLNVIVFGLKQLIHTIFYRGQLMVVSAAPRISFAAKLDPMAEEGANSVSLAPPAPPGLAPATSA